MTTEKSKVAVIAVHGVGKQKPTETARNISYMLGREKIPNSQPPMSGAGDFRFEPFTQSDLSIPVQHRWETTGANTPDTEFSADALGNLDTSDELLRYQTTSFHSEIVGNGKVSKVSVFELYWDDLSHASTFFAKFLIELYQLYFHLASLGRKAVQFAARARQPAAGWLQCINCIHDRMQWLLPTAIPILNMFLLASALPVAVLAIPETALMPSAVGLVFIVSTFLTCMLLAKFACLGWFGILLSLVVGLILCLATYVQDNAIAVLMGAALAGGLAMATLGSKKLLRRYESAPRVILAPFVALFVTLVLLCCGMLWGSPPTVHDWRTILITAAAFSVYGNFGLLQLAWLSVFILSIPIIISPFVQRFFRDSKDKSTFRALQTGRLGMLLSANLFFLTTAILWAAVLKWTQPTLCTLANVSINMPVGLLNSNIASVGGKITIPEFSNDLYTLTVGNGVNVYLVLMLFALIVVLVGVFPSVMTEVTPPPDHSKNLTSEVGQARKLACWLNGAFKSFRFAEALLIIAWLVLAIGFTPLFPDFFAGNDLITRGGWLLAGAIPALLLGRKLIPKGAAQLLDVLLDVSNWLKERPFETNPRGQILARYLSLFKHIAESGYDRIIIVAHSQGTVITLDCLRLLAQSSILRQSVFVKSPPVIELVTVGSPLRQLYRERFPHQYGWVVEKKMNGPDISSLPGVQHWINGYRSGDYVGRSLWSEPEPNMMRPHMTTNPLPQSTDLFVGTGAHLHYFDGTSCMVGSVVAKLILEN